MHPPMCVEVEAAVPNEVEWSGASSSARPRPPELRCPNCSEVLYLQNSVCLQCGSPVGFRPDLAAMAINLDAVGPDVTGDMPVGRACANASIAECNWLVPDGAQGELCRSCRFTMVRPSDDEIASSPAFARAERSKRIVLRQMRSLAIDLVDRRADPEVGLGFEFLMSTPSHGVVTGHRAGVITIDVAEADDAHRERIRQELGERYRTVLGHVRHELGHYLFPRLITSDPDRHAAFRELFGDESVDYDAARDRWYAEGPPPHDPSKLTVYAQMHPHEDWAETFAHYLLIDDAMASASEHGLERRQVGEPIGLADAIDVDERIDDWRRFVVAVNEVSRAVGHGDMYPFVITDGVRARLRFVHHALVAARTLDL